jgi:hypothetical protein
MRRPPAPHRSLRPSDPAGRRLRALAAALAVAPVCLGPTLAAAAPSSQSAGGIYSCTDARGRKLTSDRPILECLDREQRVLNKDGSTRATLPPSLTAEERAAAEEAARRKAVELAAQKDAERHDRNLLNRYPTEAAHEKAREAALDTVRDAIKESERRLAELERNRKPLLDEAEFYKGKDLPPKLRSQLEYVQVAADAQRAVVQNQQAEVGRINALFDEELKRLRKLWGGARPGTVGSVPAASR